MRLGYRDRRTYVETLSEPGAENLNVRALVYVVEFEIVGALIAAAESLCALVVVLGVGGCSCFCRRCCHLRLCWSWLGRSPSAIMPRAGFSTTVIDSKINQAKCEALR